MKTKILLIVIAGLTLALIDSIQEANSYKRVSEAFYKKIMQRNLEDYEIRKLLRDMDNLHVNTNL